MDKKVLRFFKAFVIGSSFFVVGWPFLYLGIAKTLHPEAAFDMTLVPITLPFVFGVMNMLLIGTSGKVLQHGSALRYWVFGAAYGLGLSLYGNFAKDIPVDLFQLPDTSLQYAVIPCAMLLYSCIFRYILKNLNHLFGIDHNY